jgi:hypothetical protein
MYLLCYEFRSSHFTIVNAKIDEAREIMDHIYKYILPSVMHLPMLGMFWLLSSRDSAVILRGTCAAVRKSDLRAVGWVGTELTQSSSVSQCVTGLY